ncbi:hypothetical protein PG997_000508 [Apiospora hydei]|uniref:Carboxylesterase family protein n=1 Tax=Apiospora hydei TaxID=1337664 RepID=A0ABR1XB52_9PEZI
MVSIQRPAMAPIALTGGRFDIFNDSSTDDDTSTSTVEGANVGPLGQSLISPLRPLSVSDAQNRQFKSPTRVESLAAELKRLHLGNSPELYHYKGRPIYQAKLKGQPCANLTRPPIRRDTFERLETVPEVEQRDPPESEAASVSAGTQHYIELPAHQFAKHPLALSARKLISVEEQVAKHRQGNFEWVLTVKVPVNPGSQDESDKTDSSKHSSVQTLLFGCNLLPSTGQSEKVESGKEIHQHTFTLLVTPLEGDQEPTVATPQKESHSPIAMAVGARPAVQGTPAKAVQHVPEVRIEEVSPPSDSKRGRASVTSVRVTSNSPPRIEDSVAALDQLEDELEAFDQAAHFEKIVSPISAKSPTSPMQSLSAAAHHTPGSASKVDRSSPRPVSSATYRLKSAEPERSPRTRRSASMIYLDSPKLKEEEKPLVQATPKKSTNKGLASLQPPKPLTKSNKAPTLPTFELPGEAVARRLKEKREARLSMKATAEQASVPAPSSVRRTKSARAPTVPKFELPGEAISRRKREEREARLKAQEEEERKRREFKARPIRSGTMPASIPRETITSRARQKGALAENVGKSTTTSPNKRASLVGGSLREPLSHVNNQSQPRGRHLTSEESTASSQARRATSSSTNSLGSKRGSVSIEEVQQQRLRGKDIYQRDNSYAQDREKERREREAMARLAREQAAEQSRLRSREWAEKQKRKRMTVGSVRDLVA